MKNLSVYRRSSIVLWGAVCLTAATCALQAATGPYLTLDAGANFLQDVTFKPGGAKVEMDVGYRIDVVGGLEINQWVAVELETGWMQNYIKNDPDDAWLGHVPLLANAVFRYQNNSRWTPYAGAGLGGAFTVASDDTGSDSDIVFAWQGMLGVKYAINSHMAVDLSYKYFGTTDQSYDIGGAFKLSDIHNHMVGLSFTWKF